MASLKLYSIHQIVPKILGKINGPWNKVSVTYLEVKGCVILAHYNKVRYSYISKSSKNKTKPLDQEI